MTASPIYSAKIQTGHKKHRGRDVTSTRVFYGFLPSRSGRAAWNEPGLEQTQSTDLWPGNEPMFSTWAQSQISTHTTQIKISLRNKVDHQPHKDRNRKGGGRGGTEK